MLDKRWWYLGSEEMFWRCRAGNNRCLVSEVDEKFSYKILADTDFILRWLNASGEFYFLALRSILGGYEFFPSGTVGRSICQIGGTYSDAWNNQCATITLFNGFDFVLYASRFTSPKPRILLRENAVFFAHFRYRPYRLHDFRSKVYLKKRFGFAGYFSKLKTKPIMSRLQCTFNACQSHTVLLVIAFYWFKRWRCWAAPLLWRRTFPRLVFHTPRSPSHSHHFAPSVVSLSIRSHCQQQIFKRKRLVGNTRRPFLRNDRPDIDVGVSNPTLFVNLYGNTVQTFWDTKAATSKPISNKSTRKLSLGRIELWRLDLYAFRYGGITSRRAPTSWKQSTSWKFGTATSFLGKYLFRYYLNHFEEGSWGICRTKGAIDSKELWFIDRYYTGN